MWDGAMHGFGFCADEPTRALRLLTQYTGPTDFPAGPPCVLHGSPLPLHLHLAWAYVQRTQNHEALSFLLPGLMREVDWFLSKNQGPSGLLTTYDHFYNSFGIDDDPLQHRVEKHDLGAQVAPVACTAHTIRACRICALFLLEIGEQEKAQHYLKQAQSLDAALQQHSWNGRRGRFEWVFTPDASPFAQHPLGAENDGVDGIAGLCAGIGDSVQQQQVDALFSTDHFWTNAGITAQARSGTSARIDGYWNGSVWMPHQFLLILGLLDCGRAEEALRVAHNTPSKFLPKPRSTLIIVTNVLMQKAARVKAVIILPA